MSVIGVVAQTSQSSPRGPTDYAQWVTKAVAARRLEVSTKTIEQWDKAGILPGTLYRRPTGGPRLRVYDPSRVAHLVAEGRPVRPVTNLGPGSEGATGAAIAPVAPGAFPVAGQALEGTPAAGALRGLLELLQAVTAAVSQRAQSSEKSATLFLTLEQAAAMSGLSVGWLRRARAEGRLPAVRDRWRGPAGRWHRGWKVRRADLEGL